MRNSLFKPPLLLLSCCCLAGRVSAANDSFDIDFLGSTVGSTAATSNGYATGAAAIGTASDDWNNIDISTSTYAPGNLPASQRLYNLGSILTVSSLTVSSGTYDTDALLAGTRLKNELFTPGFDALDATISGLTSGSTYDLLLYGPDATANITVNGVAFPSWTAIGASWGPTWVQGDGYNEMTVVVPSNGDLVIDDSSPSEQITAMQLAPAPAPEPSIFCLASLGGLGVLVYRRRFSRLNAA